MNKLIYVIPMLDVDIVKGVRCIKKVLSAFNINGVSAEFLVIIQTNRSHCDISELRFNENIEIMLTSDIGTSIARNRGIEYAIQMGFRFIGFLDAGILVSNNFGCALEKFLCKDSEEIFCGTLDWVNSADFNNISNDKLCEIQEVQLYQTYSSQVVRPLRDTYIGCFLFPVNVIKAFRFNPALGPGQGNSLESGEDVDFLFRVFGSKNFILSYCDSACLYHEKRKGDSKRIVYAVGQGALYRFLVKQALFNGSYFMVIRVHILFYFTLFCINSIMMSLFNGQVGRDIFKRRFFGFFHKRFQLFFTEEP